MHTPLLIIPSRPAALELDGPTVGRVLPYVRRRMVGPFIFFDHMGPATFAAGRGMDVRPHPHIGLATVTYLFEGVIDHRDSLGVFQPIRPGEVNWMTAGRGIAHSERTPDALRATETRLHGIQLWVALPEEHEEREPSFDHYDAEAIPQFDVEGTNVRLIAGNGWDRSSPVITFSPLVYAELQVPAGATLPLPDEHQELAAFIVDGALTVEEQRVEAGNLIVLDERPPVRAESAAHVMLIGGAPLGKRHIWWNFVSSSRERIEQAKRDWREGRFAKVAGDEVEFVPLP
ncbi:MAG TPA: pirin family protein [Thermoanaerobaculia bacterium]|nr:pirin family protein [Thermoanaerobaculia bacterium]